VIRSNSSARSTPRRPDRSGAVRIAVTSGKGGVGKTSLTINLAVALARLGHRVGVVDADFALGNVDVMLGLVPERHLGAVLEGQATVEDIALEGPAGVRIIPGGSGVRALTSFDRHQWVLVSDAIDRAGAGLDFLLLDTATGIGDSVIDVLDLADYVLLVTSYDPAAVLDAYAVIKLVSALRRQTPIGVVVNGVRAAADADAVYQQIALATERYLGRTLRNEGYIPDDEALRESTIAQTLLVGSDTASPAADCIRRLARRLASAESGAGPWPVRSTSRATLPLFSPEVDRCA
jgi:flagellar biosynthesis protein FlhG